MSERGHDDESRVSSGGVFGNLPGSRPHNRSPRRATGERAAKARPETRAAEAESPGGRAARYRSAAAEPPSSRAVHAEPAGAGAETAQPAPQPAGLDNLAWAGVAVVAEAATAGVRVANRVIEELLRTDERP